MINATIIGRMTKEPNLRTVTIGGVQTPVLNFTLACDDGFRKDANGKRVGTEFFRVTAWRGAAESVAKWCSKGRTVAVKGAVHLNNYLDKATNTVRPYMEIPNPDGFEFIGAHGDVEGKIANDVPEGVDELEAPWDD